MILLELLLSEGVTWDGGRGGERTLRSGRGVCGVRKTSSGSEERLVTLTFVSSLRPASERARGRGSVVEGPVSALGSIGVTGASRMVEYPRLLTRTEGIFRIKRVCRVCRLISRVATLTFVVRVQKQVVSGPVKDFHKCSLRDEIRPPEIQSPNRSSISHLTASSWTASLDVFAFW